MSESLGRKLRRALVQKLRVEGAAARSAGKSFQSNPHRYMDAYQWANGWNAKNDEIYRQEKGPRP